MKRIDPIQPTPAAIIDIEAALACVHCGLCLNTCPTYKLTGVESSSPRGRIHLMRSVAEGALEPDAEFAEEMDFCLLCRHCETVCPSGVHFGGLMEKVRGGLEARTRRPWHERFARWLGFDVILRRRFALRLFGITGRFAQRTGLVRLLARLLGSRGRMLIDAPAISSWSERRRLPSKTPARIVGTGSGSNPADGAGPAVERRGALAVLEGCVMPELFGRVNRATVESLAHLGYDVHVPTDHVCCGSLHAHNGELETARTIARETITAFERLRDERGAHMEVVVNSAGCGANMKEYGELLKDDPAWKDRAGAFSARVRDYSEVVARDESALKALHAAGSGSHAQGTTRSGTTNGLDPRAGAITYDDPCHLCHAQKIRREPRTILKALVGSALVEMPDAESCCGSAGLYSLLRPADSARVLAPKLESLRMSGASTLVVGNPGCHLQWQSGVDKSGLDVRVLHLAELVRAAQQAL